MALAGSAGHEESASISFHNWRNSLARSALPLVVKASHELEIRASLGFGKRAHAPASVALAKLFLQQASKGMDDPARSALRWFVRTWRAKSEVSQAVGAGMRGSRRPSRWPRTPSNQRIATAGFHRRGTPTGSCGLGARPRRGDPEERISLAHGIDVSWMGASFRRTRASELFIQCGGPGRGGLSFGAGGAATGRCGNAAGAGTMQSRAERPGLRAGPMLRAILSRGLSHGGALPALMARFHALALAGPNSDTLPPSACRAWRHELG